MTNAPQYRPYKSSTAVAVAGCKPSTFRAWCNRNGLFKDRYQDKGDKWARFTVPDICMLRLVVVLTNMGISAQIAVAHASLLQAKFDELYDKGKLDSSIVFISAQPDEDDEEDAYYMDGFDYQPVAVAMRTAEYGGRFPNGTAIVIDLITLMDEVLFQLDKLDAPESPPITSQADLERMACDVLIEVLDPGDEEDTE